MRVLPVAGLVIIAASVAACGDSQAAPFAPAARLSEGPYGDGLPPPADFDCIHVSPGDGVSMECSDDEPQVEGAPPSVYIDGASVSEPNP